MHMVSSQKNIIGGVNGLKRHQLVVGRPHPVHEGLQQGIVDAVTVLPAPLVGGRRGERATSCEVSKVLGRIVVFSLNSLGAPPQLSALCRPINNSIILGYRSSDN